MKKIIMFLLVCFSFLLVACEKENVEEILNKASEQVNLITETSSNISLPKNVKVDGKEVNITWSSDNEAISIEGIIKQGNDDVFVTLTAVFKYKDNQKEKEYKVKVLKKVEEVDLNKVLQSYLDTFTLPAEVETNVNLIKEDDFKYDNKDYAIKLSYVSDNTALTSEGVVTQTNTDVTVKLTVKAIIENTTMVKEFTIVVKANDNEEILNKAVSEINIPTEISTNLELTNEIVIDGKKVVVTYAFSNETITSDGKVYIPEEEDVTLDAVITFTYNGQSIDKKVNGIKVLSFYSQCDIITDELNIPSETNKDITLPESYGEITLQWTSSNRKLLTNDGKVMYTDENKEVTLSLVLVIENDYADYLFDVSYKIIIMPYDAGECIEKAHSEINIDKDIESNVTLETEFSYGVKGTWTSSNEKVLSNSGVIAPTNEDVKVTLTLKLSCRGEEREYTYDCVVKKINLDGCDEYYPYHNLVDRVSNFRKEGLNNLEYRDGKIVLSEGKTEGYYESKVFKVNNFSSVVGSYSCVSGLNFTGELQISIRINGKWSKYFTYGIYGLGRNNLYYDDSDSLAEISTDEINVLNDKTADAIKYKFIMRRTTASENSPVLSLVAMAFKIPGYVYNVDTSNLPSQKDNDLPKLYQYEVPNIGPVICSATTTTMLLKNKGFDFKNKGYQYEHEFMANMVADRGHNNPTYGNWSYNMITAGAFGVDAYVVRNYSWEEVKYLLNTVGPIGTNVRGQFGSYYTGGHLVVLRGYKETSNGTICIFNDPAVKNVYVELPLETFLTCWRQVSYIIE